MIEIADSIKAFLPATQQADFVPPSEQIFLLTGSQLQEILSRAIQPLQDEVRDLKDIVANLKGKVSALEATQDTQGENELNMLRLINDLRKEHGPQPLQRDRGEILRALIVAAGGKMLAKEARQKMHLSKPLFSMLLATMKDDIEVKPYHLNKNWKVLVLR